jgi:hypothetical protein
VLYLIFILFLILIFLLLVTATAAVVNGLIYVYKKFSLRGLSLVLFMLAASPYLAFKLYEQDFRLSVVPDALGVSSVSYSEEESWGFGSGGNEAGIRVYPLTDQVSQQITEQGLEFFKNMPPNQNQEDRQWRGLYDNWSETPVKPYSRWKPRTDGVGLNIFDYICAYGFCIEIKPEVVEESNSAVNTKGSYYAYGRIGLIVVNPKRKLVIYLYNG